MATIMGSLTVNDGKRGTEISQKADSRYGSGENSRDGMSGDGSTMGSHVRSGEQPMLTSSTERDCEPSRQLFSGRSSDSTASAEAAEAAEAGAAAAEAETKVAAAPAAAASTAAVLVGTALFGTGPQHRVMPKDTRTGTVLRAPPRHSSGVARAGSALADEQLTRDSGEEAAPALLIIPRKLIVS